MKVDTYIETLKNEGFGEVETIRMIYESQILTTIEVTDNIAVNFFKDSDGRVYAVEVYASIIEEDEIHYADIVKIIDVVTRLTTSISRTARDKIYELMSQEKNDNFFIGVSDGLIDKAILEDEGILVYTVHGKE